MRLITKLVYVSIAVSLVPALLHSQFGPPEPQGTGPKLSAPTAFPPSGTFPTTESVTLLDADPQAIIHYTLDGSAPTSKSPIYDSLHVLFVGGIYEGDHGLKSGYTIRAMAMHEGHTNSDIANFQYVIDRRDRTSYVSEEVLPGVRMVRDSDNDKMFLVKGTKKFALIDSGQGRGPLKEYLAQFTGGLPIEVIFTHNHSDHIGQADELIRDSVEHIGEADRPQAERLLESRGVPDDMIAKNLLPAHDGDRIDLGDRPLVLYAAPGHTPGSMVVFDEQTGNLFTGDSFGSNSPTIPDALWLQFSNTSLDLYLATIKSCRANFRGRVKHIMTGHNDRPLLGETYLDNLQSAVQSLMDKGDAALVPSYRPAGLQQVVVGDRLHDPDWVAVNVNPARYLPAAVDKITGLTRISVEGAKLTPTFAPEVKNYAVQVPRETSSVVIIAEPTSMRSTALAINGDPVQPGTPHRLPFAGKPFALKIRVTSPDGTRTAEYTVEVSSR